VTRVRRAVAGASALFCCAVAGILAAGVVAANGPASGSTTGTTTAATTTTATTTTAPTTTTTPATTGTTTSTATTTTAGTTTTPAPKPKPKPKAPKIVRDGVRIGGVDVSGLTAMTAASVVRAAFGEPLVLLVNGRTLVVPPVSLGGRARVLAAVERALRAPAGTNVWLGVTVDRRRLDDYLERLAKRFDRPAIDSHLRLRNLRPVITKDRRGRGLDTAHARTAIRVALERNRRKPLHLRLKDVPAVVNRSSFGPIIVIRRGSNRLYLYNGMKYVRVFGVATGSSEYPSPLGRYEIVVKQRNPWWYPPASDWAKDAKPVPPGPGNPLGTRWMGISAPAVGIHGTPDAASIGYSASHGCIRMRIPDAEWLFEYVEIGTPVFIVAA
jgi:L,D-transpeptidase catalytic domain/Putative peptidoglycan binding domain